MSVQLQSYTACLHHTAVRQNSLHTQRYAQQRTRTYKACRLVFYMLTQLKPAYRLHKAEQQDAHTNTCKHKHTYTCKRRTERAHMQTHIHTLTTTTPTSPPLYLNTHTRPIHPHPHPHPHTHTHIHTHTSTHIHTHTHTHTHPHPPTHKHKYTRAHPSIHPSIHPSVPPSLPPSLHPHTPAYIHTYMHTPIYLSMVQCVCHPKRGRLEAQARQAPKKASHVGGAERGEGEDGLMQQHRQELLRWVGLWVVKLGGRCKHQARLLRKSVCVCVSVCAVDMEKIRLDGRV